MGCVEHKLAIEGSTFVLCGCQVTMCFRCVSSFGCAGSCLKFLLGRKGALDFRTATSSLLDLQGSGAHKPSDRVLTT